MRLQSLLLAATAFSASCLAQLDLTSCESTNYTCMEARIRADQALVELPNFVTYPIQSDHFYDTPANISGAQAGQILKLEMYTNSTPYSIPPGQSLSRIMYASLDNFGAIVPATAAILWPFSPKSFNGSQSYPLVAWAHGTSGIDRQCAVSNLRNLQYDFRSVFTLASAGYAVVMADYVGLGSDNFFNYLAYKLHANDVVYSVAAAQSVFPELSKEWVSFGHSEGGGVAWAVGERQAIQPIPGFLGTIAAAPPPFPLATTAPASNSVFQAFLTFTISHLYGLDLDSIFHPEPLRALRLVQSIGGCNDAGYAAFGNFSSEDIYANTSWPSSQAAVNFARDYSVSGRPLGGPMLILQGSSDTVVGTAGAMAGYNMTCTAQGNNVSVNYISVIGMEHNPSLYAAQPYWLQWIADRFNGLPTQSGCQMSNLTSGRERVQLPERFLVEHTKPWITIFSSTFMPESLQAAHYGFVEVNDTLSS